MKYVEQIHEMKWDNLIGSTGITSFTANVVFAQAAEAAALERGTVLAKTADGKYVPVNPADAATKAAVAILESPVTLAKDAEVVGTVYTSGMFNRERLIVPEGDTVEAHEDELRQLGIYLTSIKGVTAENTVNIPAAEDGGKKDQNTTEKTK